MPPERSASASMGHHPGNKEWAYAGQSGEFGYDPLETKHRSARHSDSCRPARHLFQSKIFGNKRLHGLLLLNLGQMIQKLR
jgi:hypothetical protein